MPYNAGDYLAARDSLRENYEGYRLSWDTLQCMTRVCFPGSAGQQGEINARSLGDAASNYDTARSNIDQLLATGDELVERLCNLIALFSPKKASFETYTALIYGDLSCIINQGYSPEADADLIKNITSMRNEINTICTDEGKLKNQYCGWINGAAKANSDLQGRSQVLLGYRQQCISNKCGCFGHGNPAIGIMNNAANFQQVSGSMGPNLRLMLEFILDVDNRLGNVEKSITELSGSDPGHHPENAQRALNGTVQQWNDLVNQLIYKKE
ncbi:MAG: hypothetical protein ACOY46_04950 [Bacillota bacterium]